MLWLTCRPDIIELRGGPGLWPLMALASARLVSWLWAGAPTAGEHYVLWAVSGPVAYLVWCQDRGAIRPALRTLSVVLALLQLARWQTNIQLLNLNIMGNWLLICLVSWLPERGRATRAELAGLAVTAAALLSTTSRGAAAGAVVMLAGYAGQLWLAAPVGAVVILVLLHVRNPATLGLHLEIWSEHLTAWLRAPILGNGAGATEGHGHNLLVTLLSWEGLAGATAVSAALGYLAREARRFPRWALWGLAGVALQFLVDDLTHAPLSMALLAALLAADSET